MKKYDIFENSQQEKNKMYILRELRLKGLLFCINTISLKSYLIGCCRSLSFG